MNTCIEFDGRQHYAPVEAFGGEKSLNERQRLDGIKTKYCLDNGIRLIRIRFDESVDDVLTKILVWGHYLMIYAKIRNNIEYFKEYLVYFQKTLLFSELS